MILQSQGLIDGRREEEDGESGVDEPAGPE